MSAIGHFRLFQQRAECTNSRRCDTVDPSPPPRRGEAMPEKTYGKKTIVVPDEHKEFVAELQNLFSKYPKAASRYGLSDLGDNHVRTRAYDNGSAWS